MVRSTMHISFLLVSEAMQLYTRSPTKMEVFFEKGFLQKYEAFEPDEPSSSFLLERGKMLTKLLGEELVF